MVMKIPRKTPAADGSPEDIFGCMRDVVEIVGEVEASVDPLENWEALAEFPRKTKASAVYCALMACIFP
jgi:hypothetical protein